MKRFGILALLLVTMVGSVACLGTQTYLTIPVSKTLLTPTAITTVTDSLPTTLATSSQIIEPVVTTIKTKDDLAQIGVDIIYPAVIIFQNYVVGVGMNTWFLDDRTAVFGHNMGDVLGLRIYNSHDEPAVFSIEYRDDSSRTCDAASGITFQQVDANNWVDIKYPTISLKPHELATIPFTLRVPPNTIVPDNWSFQLVVTDVTFSGQISTNSATRVLVEMQKY